MNCADPNRSDGADGSRSAAPGKVYLVGAGPGDPGLLTLKGKVLLEQADAVVYDALVSPAILGMIGEQAERIDAGKRRGRHSRLQAETTQLLIDKTRDCAVVVRLKGGDPFVFGRGGEEMQDLVAAGVPVEVVPGITSGVAAPAYAGIPLTHRHLGSSVAFVTGHEAAGRYRPQVDWHALARGTDTIVVYMGVRNLPAIIAQLREAGLSSQTPIALVRWGTWSQQAILTGTLATICDRMAAAQFGVPAIAAIGNIVQLSEILPTLDPPQ